MEYLQPKAATGLLVVSKDLNNKLNISLQNFVFKLQLCIKLANFNVIEVERLILLRFALIIKITVNKYDNMIF